MTLDDEIAMIRLFKLGVLNVDESQGISFTNGWLDHMNKMTKGGKSVALGFDINGNENMNLYLLRTFIGGKFEENEDTENLVRFLVKVRDSIINQNEPYHLPKA